MTTTRTEAQMRELICPLFPPADYGNGIVPQLGPACCLATRCMACERAGENDRRWIKQGDEIPVGWEIIQQPPAIPYGWVKNVSAPVTYICSALESKVVEVEHG